MISRQLLLGALFYLYCCCFLLVMVCGCLAKPVAEREARFASSLADDSSGVFWPESLDWNVNALFTEDDRSTLVKKMRTLSVISLEPGCGRMKNRLATLEDGSRVCCRFRDNGNQLRGDVYAYHFNRLLGMWNIPATIAIKLDLSGKQWESVKTAATEAGWKDRVTVVVSQFIDGLEDEYFPLLLKNVSSFHPLTLQSASNLSTADTKALMEWTDMIVFDYIIGHTDRLFNALLNLKWNSHMMEKPVHNLKKTASSSDLVLLDNESGFDLGYIAAEKREGYFSLQIAFLERICVFRAPTISALAKLGSTDDDSKSHPSPSALVEQYMRQVDPLSFSALWRWKDEAQREFDRRVRTVLERVDNCALLVT